MEFASEMVIHAAKAGLVVDEVPITYYPRAEGAEAKLRSFRDGWRHLRFMLLYSPKWLFIVPGVILTIVGAAGFAFLLPEPLMMPGGITFDLNSLLVSSATMLSGVQILAFGLFLRAYAVKTGLLPGQEYWLRMTAGRSVEWGIFTGLILALVGTGFLIKAFLVWKAAGFGPLPYQESLRLVISAVTGICLGAQVTAFGFALAILGLEK
jgi:hypothetical protein